MCNAAGDPVWSEAAGMHMTAAAYVEVAAALVAICKDRSASSSSKRARLGSVVPGPPPKKRGALFFS